MAKTLPMELPVAYSTMRFTARYKTFWVVSHGRRQSTGRLLVIRIAGRSGPVL